MEVNVELVKVTFYGFDDNDDGTYDGTDGQGPGTATISFPNIHKIATEDEGSYDHPSTFATEPKFLQPGTRIYVPRVKKYYIMEDGCVECTADWKEGIKHVDLYIGGNTHKIGQKLIDREEELTFSDHELIVINPPPGLPVNTDRTL